MSSLRLGDDIDDYCSRCRRLTNHVIVSFLQEQPAKVRCRTCYHEHDYLHARVPPSRKDSRLSALGTPPTPADPRSPAPKADARSRKR